MVMATSHLSWYKNVVIKRSLKVDAGDNLEVLSFSHL